MTWLDSPSYDQFCNWDLLEALSSGCFVCSWMFSLHGSWFQDFDMQSPLMFVWYGWSASLVLTSVLSSFSQSELATSVKAYQPIFSHLEVSIIESLTFHVKDVLGGRSIRSLFRETSKIYVLEITERIVPKLVWKLRRFSCHYFQFQVLDRIWIEWTSLITKLVDQTAQTPNIRFLVIETIWVHFWSWIARSSHKFWILLSSITTDGTSKITYLYGAVLRKKNVTQLQVSMNHLISMDIF